MIDNLAQHEMADAPPDRVVQPEAQIKFAVDSICQNVHEGVERRLITSALPYINNVPHLGHMVGSHLPADIFARFCRMKGYDTLFVGGSDENGTPSEIAADSIGVDIQHFCDVLHSEHEKIYKWFEISYDQYSRTSSNIHHKMTQEFFKMILENGYVSHETVEMFFDPQMNMFLADRYINGTCPKCGYDNANGDQCEKCSSVLSVDELINPKSKLTGSTPVKKKSEHLFLNLDMLSEKLEEWINSNEHWKPQVRNLALGWIKEGLRPRSITRDLRHGVKVPLEGYENKVFYVWFDAPIAYVSATVEADPKGWQRFWEEPNSKIYHFLGKDNIPFHTIFWPGIVLAEGKKNLPYQVAGMQNLNYEGGKFSKSQKRGVFCEALPESGIHPDVMRAYLTFVIPETADSEFRWEDFQQRVNTEIIGKFGNFIHRTLTFIQNKLGGEIHAPQRLSAEEENMLNAIRKKIQNIEEEIEGMRFRQAFAGVIGIAEMGNKYFSDSEPWKVVKTDVERAKNILYICALLCKTLASVASPFIPSTSQKIWEQLNLQGEVDNAESWQKMFTMELPAFHKITQQPQVLFEKVTDDLLAKYQEKTKEVKPLTAYFGKEEIGSEGNF